MDLRPKDVVQEANTGSFIDTAVCENLVSKPINVLVPIDGSDTSMVGLEYVVSNLMQHDRTVSVEVLHIYDDSKTYLPFALRPDVLKATVETKLTSSVSAKRSQVTWLPKNGIKAGEHVCKRIDVFGKSDFVVIGFLGRKTRKDRVEKYALTSNTFEVLCRGKASAIIMKNETVNLLPTGRPTKFVVSVSLNAASTKAFLDALRLSQPGDEIHLLYVKSYMENTDSDYTVALKEKYCAFFAGLKEESEKVFFRFHDRQTSFNLISKEFRQTTAQAVVKYADDIDADFIVVGTNHMRVARGKQPLGSVSLDICLETDRNVIVAHWNAKGKA